MKYRTAFARLSKGALCGVLLLASSLTIGFFTPRRWFQSATCKNQPYRIYVQGDAMHVNLLMPVDNGIYDWRQFIDLKQIGSDTNENYSYLKMGWGDRIWYTEVADWSQMNALDIGRVLFKPGNTTVMYVQGYSSKPDDVKCVGLDREQYLNFVRFLQKSFARDAQGKLAYIKPGAATTDGFYAATGNYSALRTCNTWSAEALDAARINTPLWSAIAPAVMRQIPTCSCP